MTSSANTSGKKNMGIEFECLVPNSYVNANAADVSETYYNHNRAKTAVAKALMANANGDKFLQNVYTATAYDNHPLVRTSESNDTWAEPTWSASGTFNNGQWHVNDDCTPTKNGHVGIEVISPLPHARVGNGAAQNGTGFNSYESIRNVAKTLQSICGVNITCGTHVTLETIDASGRKMNADDMKRFMKLWLVFENTMESIIAKSRRSTGSCGRWASKVSKPYKRNGSMADAFDSIDSESLAASVSAYWSRCSRGLVGNDYCPSANMANWANGDRVEFRGHQGTLDAEKIINYGEVCEMFLAAAMAGVEVQPTSWNSTASFQDMISVLEGGNVEYFMMNADGSSQRYHTTWNSVQSGHYTRQGNGVQGSEMSMRGNLWFYYDAQAGRDGMVADEVRRNEAVRFANMAVAEGICEYPYAIQQVTRWRNHRIANPIVTGTADNTALVTYYEARQQQLA